MSKKVLFTAKVARSHINTFHLPYLEWFQNEGYKTFVASNNDFKDGEVNIPYCDEFIELPFSRNPLSKDNYIAYKMLKKLLQQNQFDIIHCHTPIVAAITRFAARKTRENGAKVIYTAHGFHFYKGAPILNWLIYFPIEWIASLYNDVLITITEEDFNLANKLFINKNIKHVPGVGVNNEKYYPAKVESSIKNEFKLNDDSYLILMVGELNSNKNHKVIIEAISKLQDDSIHLLIAGDGELIEELRNLSQQLNVIEKVHFLNYRNNLNEIYNQVDLFCFPSKREGLSLALMEAMSSGLPIVCSDIRGNNELVENYENGFRVHYDNVNEYVDSILKVKNDSELAIVMAKNNVEKMKSYNITTVKKMMIEIYLELMGDSYGK